MEKLRNFKIFITFLLLFGCKINKRQNEVKVIDVPEKQELATKLTVFKKDTLPPKQLLYLYSKSQSSDTHTYSLSSLSKG